MNLKITEDELRILKNVEGKRLLFNNEVIVVGDLEIERVVDTVGRRKKRRETIYLTSVKFSVWDYKQKYYGRIVDDVVVKLICWKDLQAMRADYLCVVEQIVKLNEEDKNEKDQA